GVNSTLLADLIQVGKLLYEEKDYDAAVRSYQAVLNLTKDQPRRFAAERALAHRLMAEPLLQKKAWREAGVALEEFLKTVPPPALGQPLEGEQAKEMARAFKARGILHVEQKDFRLAIDSYTAALKISRDPDTLALRGWAYVMWDAPHLADAVFTESL